MCKINLLFLIVGNSRPYIGKRMLENFALKKYNKGGLPI